MNSRMLWILAIVVTLASAVYQRATGPTYPKRVSWEAGETAVKARLPRSHSVSADMVVPVTVQAGDPTAVLRWRHYPTDQPWTEVPMTRVGDRLEAPIPAQPASGKVEYMVMVTAGEESVSLAGDEAVVARYKGDVPAFILAPHILFMFLGMLWSNRTGMEALAGGPKRDRMALITLGLLFAGGLILGPIVQKYAFGAYWTGWPFGEDLTDNKLAVAVLAWFWAVLRRGPGKGARTVAVVAMLVVFAVYMIPHSVRGSTLNYETGEMVSH